MTHHPATLNAIEKSSDARGWSNGDAPRRANLEWDAARDRWRIARSPHPLEREAGAGRIDRPLADERAQRPQHGSERPGGRWSSGVLKHSGSWLV